MFCVSCVQNSFFLLRNVVFIQGDGDGHDEMPWAKWLKFIQCKCLEPMTIHLLLVCLLVDSGHY